MGAIMTKLVLGVIDLPYADAGSYKELRTKKPKHKQEGNKTTGDVAEILEDKYHVMEVFYESHVEQIGDYIVSGMEAALEAVMMGAPAGQIDAHGQATGNIDRMFKEFLANKEMESMGIPGVPTLAAQEGHSKRFKQPYKKRKPRPSFIDTGLYQASFKSDVED